MLLFLIYLHLEAQMLKQNKECQVLLIFFLLVACSQPAQWSACCVGARASAQLTSVGTSEARNIRPGRKACTAMTWRETVSLLQLLAKRLLPRLDIVHSHRCFTLFFFPSSLIQYFSSFMHGCLFLHSNCCHLFRVVYYSSSDSSCIRV